MKNIVLCFVVDFRRCEQIHLKAWSRLLLALMFKTCGQMVKCQSILFEVVDQHKVWASSSDNLLEVGKSARIAKLLSTNSIERLAYDENIPNRIYRQEKAQRAFDDAKARHTKASLSALNGQQKPLLMAHAHAIPRAAVKGLANLFQVQCHILRQLAIDKGGQQNGRRTAQGSKRRYAKQSIRVQNKEVEC